MHPAPVAIEQVRAQARADAHTYTNVNDACPYPFASDEGHAYAAEFRQARADMAQATHNAKDGNAP